MGAVEPSPKARNVGVFSRVGHMVSGRPETHGFVSYFKQRNVSCDRFL